LPQWFVRQLAPEGQIVTDDVRDGSQPAGEPGVTPTTGDATPGAALAASRERAGLSVEDVAAATRIRATLVRAIEHDEYERCGGEVYARGHIRSIAHVVGADAEGLVADFDRRYGRQLPKLTVAPVSTKREPVREVTRKATKSTPKWPAAAIAVLSLIVVLLAVSWVVGRRTDRGTPPLAGGTGAVTNPAVTPSETPTATPTTPPATTAPPTSKPPSGVTVHVQVTTGTSWVRVTSSAGIQLYEGILSGGQSKDFHDPTALALRFGNSNVVELTVNGTKVGRPCNPQVCDQSYPTDRTQAG
jgi:cytoskeleton protein RodZ